ncbi:GNAT family N-acetyltransferase [Actinomycetospora endophytica]|uniref:GNAT family N-acetyltransferase n=1 Tax=Actinomycetospora endophytica TaxID=2291215 RepID=A0ABS8P8S8_9PSEU|nr:GNAT family N-acetyltransferase [Actinomycetospora endophytica]MCD2193796.1 GNAT family N-acetyltransferase [Actinomycetospora endophytica]
MDVRPCSVEEAVTLAFEPEAFPARFGLRLVPGWAVPGALEPTVDALEGGADPAWLTHLLVCDGAVVGMGGFTGPPLDGEVEIGYQIAPARRGRGIATTAVAIWVARARAARLARVVARTDPGPSASATVLGRSGFARDPERDDGCWWWVCALRAREH